MNYYSVFKTLAFNLDPEFVHDLSISTGHRLPAIAKFFTQTNKNDLSLSVNNLKWKTPIGLAAGFDKNAKCIPFFQNLGFGAIEVGTITKVMQKGNPKPRVFRIPELKSLRNAMGFPNLGSQEIFNNIINSPKAHCLGCNIGKNKWTNEKQTPEEYAYLYEMFSPVSDYITINISSPNTPGLRNFQKKELLSPILEAVHDKRVVCDKPIFIKIAPDLDIADIEMLCELVKEFNFEGVIATNTTTQHNYGLGGLSGDYIKPYSLDIRNKVCETLRETKDKTIIGVGGISTYEEIKDFWIKGGSFVQIYTSLIYYGPKLLENIYRDMELDVKEKQLSNVQELYNFYQSK